MTQNQLDVLNAALAIKGAYMPLADQVLATLPSGSPELDGAIRAMAYRMAVYNGGQPDAEMIINVILNSTWEDIGVAGVAVLDTAQREGIISAIMAVSKGVIAGEAARLTALAESDTDFPAPPPEEE